MKPTASIIIPCYNAEAYVAEAIQSALDQTYSQTEVIVIDDGSTDRSLEVIRSFGERVQWESGPNRGACAARNRGVELAQGDWIQFLDADDWLLPEKIACQLPVALQHPGELVFTAGELGQPDGSYEPHEPDPAVRDPIEFAIEDWVPTPAPLHRKTDLVSVGGFNVDLPCSQERDLHLRLALKGMCFRFLNRQLFRTRSVPGSISSNWHRALEQRRKIFAKVEEELYKNHALTEGRKHSLARVHANDGRSLLYLGEIEAAVDRLAKARHFDPVGWLNPVYEKPWHRRIHRLFGARTMSYLSRTRRAIQSMVALRRPTSSASANAPADAGIVTSRNASVSQ